MKKLTKQEEANSQKKFYAVIDTNVLVSALLTSKDDVATVKVLNYLVSGTVVPLYNDKILNEYITVLSRDKFKFDLNLITSVVNLIKYTGIFVQSNKTNIVLPDMKDVPFYEIVLEKRDNNAYLVTGNIKHFTTEAFIVTPAEFIKIIEDDK